MEHIQKCVGPNIRACRNTMTIKIQTLCDPRFFVKSGKMFEIAKIFLLCRLRQQSVGVRGLLTLLLLEMTDEREKQIIVFVIKVSLFSSPK